MPREVFEERVAAVAQWRNGELRRTATSGQRSQATGHEAVNERAEILETPER
jgi:hypothetical protein